MANVNDIPRGYAMTGKLNLRADPREYRRWNLFSAVLGLGLIAAGWVWHSFAPLKALFEAGFSVYFLRIAALAAGLFLYAQGYQLMRALALRLLGGQGPCWRRQGLLQIPGSYAYFSRGRFALAALSPLLLWTAALLGTCFLVPVDWFWIVYLILIYDLGGNLAVFAQTGREVLAPREQPRIAVGGGHMRQEIDREHVPLAGKARQVEHAHARHAVVAEQKLAFLARDEASRALERDGALHTDVVQLPRDARIGGKRRVSSHGIAEDVSTALTPRPPTARTTFSAWAIEPSENRRWKRPFPLAGASIADSAFPNSTRAPETSRAARSTSSTDDALLAAGYMRPSPSSRHIRPKSEKNRCTGASKARAGWALSRPSASEVPAGWALPCAEAP